MSQLQKRVPRREKSLQDLSPQEVESALDFLYNAEQEYPPLSLRHLTDVEWTLLDHLLASLLHEKQHSHLH
jgi:hypothetical protein